MAKWKDDGGMMLRRGDDGDNDDEEQLCVYGLPVQLYRKQKEEKPWMVTGDENSGADSCFSYGDEGTTSMSSSFSVVVTSQWWRKKNFKYRTVMETLMETLTVELRNVKTVPNGLNMEEWV